MLFFFLLKRLTSGDHARGLIGAQAICLMYLSRNADNDNMTKPKRCD